MSITAREAAFKALGVFRRDKTWPGKTLGNLFGDTEESAREAALAAQITNGVMQNMMFCDHIISFISSVELKKLEPRVLDILRLSVFQLVFLTGVPPSAAVNEGVALAKRYSNPRAAGYVNAILRKAAELAQNNDFPEITGDTAHRLSVRYSHPQWLTEILCEALGNDGAEAFLAMNNSVDTAVTVQVNTQRAKMDETLSVLSKDCDAKPHELLDDCMILHGAGNITRLDAFKKGHFYAQDAASRLAVIAAGPKKGHTVLDGCAAPGGKSFTSAVMMENSGKIIACDVSEDKIQKITDGAARMGLSIIEPVCCDSSVPVESFFEVADIVLADVPCSGFGVIRKKPEIRYKTEREIAGLPDIQKRILSTLSNYVKPGGILLYSTCTILRRENEDVIDRFLFENSQFSLAEFDLPGIGNVQNGMLTLWPHIHNTDGFFMCKMRRQR